MPPRRLRLDAELVRRGLARSREHASELIAAGRVRVAGGVATKPATGVTTDVAIVVADDPDRPDYVSRGGHKLAGALAAFEPLGLVGDRAALPGRRRVDRRLHRRAAPARCRARWWRSTWATGSWRGACGRTSGCAWSTGRTSASSRRTLIGGPVDLVVGDLSFISLSLVLDALIGVTAPDGDLALMVKPQFEVGKDRVGKGGVVRDPALRAEAVCGDRRRRRRSGAGVPARSRPARCRGRPGNVEFFLWLRSGAATVTDADIDGRRAGRHRPGGGG